MATDGDGGCSHHDWLMNAGHRVVLGRRQGGDTAQGTSVKASVTRAYDSPQICTLRATG